ncbi:hypothetical protein [Halochromatium glycolicum]|uniref:Uncharacterized protein n=1 Tax=Halochromatium glycolicum TaxID=85075 RepID=A0AAJ0U8Y3_9GAMM|nr:hypothetical protein [Halochromatium glycolicum]MBK1706930.1 hypothetical protein [Halochromatium glycolicum]
MPDGSNARRLRLAKIHLLSAEKRLTYNPLLPGMVAAPVLPGHRVGPRAGALRVPRTWVAAAGG